MTKTAKVKVSALDTEIQIHLYGERPKPPKRQEPIEHSLEFWSYSGEIMMTRYNDETSLKDKKKAVGTTKTKLESTKLSNAWKLYTDEASSSDGSGVRLMLINPKGKEYTYALRFEFETTNNEAEYEALLAWLQIAKEMEIKSLAIFADSQLMHIQRNQNKKANALSKLSLMTFEHLTKEVLVEVLAKKSIDNKEVLHVKVKEGES
ncbi:reverse transcriptase domain-containing protein [Tanacetum coccineum]